MITLPIFFSLIFFVAFTIYLFFGFYIFSINSKSIMNRVFFVLCLALCVWTFSFSIANSAPDYESALFWRRLAALGWGTIYSFLLHFILILTEKNDLLKKKWIYFLLYVPALVNIFAFSLYYNLVTSLYNLNNTSLGWANTSANSLFDLHFNIYYMSFTIIGLVLILKWGRNTYDQKKKKQSYLLVSSFAVALLLGSLTDIIFNKYLSFIIPQLTPVIIIIPTSAIFYSIKHYGLMTQKKSTEITKTGRILNGTAHSKIYQYLSIAYIFGGLLSFAIQYFIYNEPIKGALIFFASLILVGLSFLFFRQLRIKQEYQDTILAFLTGISIAVIILRSIKYAGLTVWAISFVFIILSVIFSKRVLIILSSFILFANIWMWAKVPYKTVYVDGVHHFLRICICILALWLAFYVNQVYIKRLKENEDQIMFQKMISQISTQFVTVTQANLDEKIKEMLKLCGDYYQMDRTYLFLSSEDEKTMTYSYEWCNEGIEPAIDIIKEVPTDAFPWCMKQTLNNDVNHLPDVEILKIQSLISIPVTNNGKILGFLGFDIAHKEDYLRNDYQDMFKVLANLLADALVKIATEKEINYMAYYDALTGLPNRTLFKNRLEQEIYLVKRTEKLIGLIFIDLDSFKSVNDTMGHEGGDDLLKQVACRFSECVRKHDTISRFGGDEFLIMLTNISSVGDIHKIANNIISVFNQPLKINNQEFFITSSAGIAIYPADGENAEELIKNADLAMYSSKEKGKNQYTLCSPVMKENVLEKTQLTNNLYRAQEKNELVLYYQPQVDITTKEIIGLEALIRWNHPSLGMISPCTFIPLAEQTGLINSIGEWVLQTACRQNKKWQDMGLKPIRMAVNLSIKQFHSSGLVELVAKILNESGLEPKYLELEITESTAVKESNYIIEILQELKKLGVTIAIDDFGTEYSSLSRLKLLPVDRLKIDMQFVHNIANGNKDEAIAKVIIQLAKNLNLDVIAEGVETSSQYDFFNKQRCDEVQGYYCYKPMPAKELEVILLKQFVKK